jgi:hypothetical protein
MSFDLFHEGSFAAPDSDASVIAATHKIVVPHTEAPNGTTTI